MKYVFIFLCGLLKLGKTELCTDNTSMYDLPPGPLTSFISLYTLGTMISYTGCSERYIVNPNKIRFWLFNKENYETPLRLSRDNPSELNPSRKIIFILHGWTCNITQAGFPEMKRAFLTRYPDANLIFIEWTTYAIDYYLNAFCYIPKIAQVIGRFVCNLNAKYKIGAQSLHFVGHSMGAHLSGITGQETRAQCTQTIGRITGLDPAGPVYQLVGESRRLDSTDASIVDVIHTNQGMTGYYGACGSADFYPNCGYQQPGCRSITATRSIADLLNIPFKIFLCSHMRSVYYFTESILSDTFEAESCTLCPGALISRFCFKDFFFGSKTIMGEGYAKNIGPGTQYYVNINSKPPFSKA